MGSGPRTLASESASSMVGPEEPGAAMKRRMRAAPRQGLRAAALALVAAAATAASWAALGPVASPAGGDNGAAGLLSVRDGAALKGALAAVKGDARARGRTAPHGLASRTAKKAAAPGESGEGGSAPFDGGWSIAKLLKNGLDWDGKKDVAAGRSVIMVPPPLIVPKPPMTITINGKGGAGKADEAANQEKVLIPVKALDTLEEMNRRNKADLAQLRHALGAAKAEGAREHGGPAAAQVPSLPATGGRSAGVRLRGGACVSSPGGHTACCPRVRVCDDPALSRRQAHGGADRRAAGGTQVADYCGHQAQRASAQGGFARAQAAGLPRCVRGVGVRPHARHVPAKGLAALRAACTTCRMRAPPPPSLPLTSLPLTPPPPSSS